MLRVSVSASLSHIHAVINEQMLLHVVQLVEILYLSRYMSKESNFR